MYEFKPVRNLHGTRDDKKIRKFKRGGRKIVDIYLSRESMRANSRKNDATYYSSIPWSVMTGFLFSRIGRPMSEVISEFSQSISRKYLKYDSSGAIGTIERYLDKNRRRYSAKTGFYEAPDGTLQWKDNVDYDFPGKFKSSLGPTYKAVWNKQNIKIPQNLEYRDTLGCENPVFIGNLWAEPLNGKHRKAELQQVYLVSSYKWCGAGKYGSRKKFPKSRAQMRSWKRVSLVGVGTNIEIILNRSYYYTNRFYWYYIVKKDEK